MPDTLVEQLDKFYTSTWANRQGGVAEQVFNSRPFWYFLKKGGGMKKVRGGRRIELSLRYGKSPNVQWIGRGTTVGTGDMEHLTIAYYPWRYLVDSIVRFGVDDQQNRDKHKIIDLANSKIDTANDTLVEVYEQALFGAQAGISMLGLQNLVDDVPSGATTVGGIPQADYDWWRNQQKDAAGVFSMHGVNDMRTMLNNCMNNLGMDRPDIIVCGQSPYEYYEEEARVEHLRINDRGMADMGFMHQAYKGIPMIWSPECADTRMYFLNTKFIYFAYDPMYYFSMTGWKDIPNQVNDRVVQIITACNLITNRRRCHGVINGLNN